MAFPASQQTLADALAAVSRTATSIRQRTVVVRNASAAGPIARQLVVDLQRALADAVAAWDAQASRPGLAAYAQQQFNDPTLDVAAEFGAMRAAAVKLRDWIHANFPRDAATGAVLVRTYDVNGVPTELTFPSAVLAEFRTRCDTFLATIG